MQGRYRRLGYHAQQTPVFRLGERPGLHDLDRVAVPRFVLLVVYVPDGPPADVLAVAWVLYQAGDLHAPRLVHLVAGDDAHGHPALAAVFILPGAFLGILG